MMPRLLPILLALSPVLALAACQSTGTGPGTRSLNGSDTAAAAQVGFTAAAADRCAVPYNARRLQEALIARTAAGGTGVERRNDALGVYNEVFEGMRRRFATDQAFCTPERLAQTREDVATYGG
jgi:hypothetical protein